MEQVVKLKIKQVVVAGKTGTVQVASREAIEKIDGEIPEHLKNHAWFFGFAPFDKPEVSVIVFLEHGGSGGRNAAVVAHDIFNDIFS